jgi:coenzyme F420-reducing hydrogenase alpha subunit
MSDTIRLEQVKRIEGHGRISLFVDDGGTVSDAHFDILEFRGFEQMVKDRMVWEMPLITSRICGVCPVSHHLAAVKAVDDLYNVTIPPAARMLRESMHLGGMIQDHALHFFFLAGPDFLTGDGSGSRDILGVIKGAPELALKAIGIRKAGQRIVATIGGRSSHPVAAIPGGMSKGITEEQRSELLGMVRDTMDDAVTAAEVARESTMRLLEENPGYAITPMPMMAITTADGGFDLYDGDITVLETDGSVLERWSVSEFETHIAEKVVPNSYAKSPYLMSKGESGSYRVGPLARLNIAESMPGERSQELMERFRTELGRPVHATLAYHWARMIELVAAYERLEELLSNDEVLSNHVRVQVNRGPGSGTAVTEAPRGTLIHHYEADDVGRVTRAELIVATTQNTASLDAAVLEAVAGEQEATALSDESVRRMELGIRAHDPCLSCATHEIGRMPLVVEVHGPDGTLLSRRGVE